MAQEQLTKNEKRVAAREKAAAMRLAEKKKAKRRKITGWATAGVGVLAVGALVAFVVIGNNASKVAASVTAPANMATDGVILTSPTKAVENTGYNLESGKAAVSSETLAESDVPHVEVYVDYSCPHCGEFEEANSPYLTSLLESGRATLEVKPIVVLNTPLSFSGGNAAACVANYAPSQFLDYNNGIFAYNAETGTATQSAVRSVLKDLDLTTDERKQINACNTSDEFGNWLQTATENALARTSESGEKLVTGTPTVLVDGVKFPYGYDGFQPFMEKVLQGFSAQEIIDATEADQPAPGEETTIPNE
jgi:protein-disulfide isomerase